MWRWLIIIALLGFKLNIPICCVRFNYEAVSDKPAVEKRIPPAEAERFDRLVPYLDHKPHK
ncbi:MAG: hypothetical protein E3J72_06685 [Planctomycetota bacterium]|nr:MAG: hypothetical protein E3J72_06685 [Planctomycetota bacterium]